MISLGSRLIACCKLAPTLARQMWRHNYVIDRNEYLIFTLSESVNFWVYALQCLFKSTNNSWRYERKCEWVFFSEHSVYSWLFSDASIYSKGLSPNTINDSSQDSANYHSLFFCVEMLERIFDKRLKFSSKYSPNHFAQIFYDSAEPNSVSTPACSTFLSGRSKPHLYPGLGEAGSSSEVFARVDVRVVGSFERSFQMFQLVDAERRPVSSLFASRIVVDADVVVVVVNVFVRHVVCRRNITTKDKLN